MSPRAPRHRWLWPALAAAAALVGAAAFACNGEPLRGVGAVCALHTDCNSGICADSVCITRSGDDDGDRLTNQDELWAGSDPLNPDSDGDEIPDGAEVGPDPHAPLDSDADGRPDFRESAVHDRDLDGLSDQDDPTDDVPELDAGVPCAGHADCGDGICTGGQCHGADEDLDLDGISNGTERALGTNPLNADSDGDGVKDRDELGDPAHPTDTDGDGRIDARESSRVDSDGDGTNDQTDPN